MEQGLSEDLFIDESLFGVVSGMKKRIPVPEFFKVVETLATILELAARLFGSHLMIYGESCRKDSPLGF